jgi:dTDP-4-amino-4,6-dideoxygalactose transaminase
MNYGGLHHDFGNSSRITELGALLGLIQLKKLPQMMRKRQTAYDTITKKLDAAGLDYVSTAHMDAASQYKLIVHVPAGRQLEAIKKALGAEGVIVGGGVYELPCHKQPVFEGICAGETYPGADRWCPNHLCPPLTSGMTEDEARFVGEMLVKHLA